MPSFSGTYYCLIFHFSLFFIQALDFRQLSNNFVNPPNYLALRNFPVRNNHERNNPESRKNPEHIHKSRT
jgi:hypothetical protein